MRVLEGGDEVSGPAAGDLVVVPRAAAPAGRPGITPHLPAVLGLVAGGEVDPLPVFSDHLTFDSLPETLALLPEKPLVTHE